MGPHWSTPTGRLLLPSLRQQRSPQGPPGDPPNLPALNEGAGGLWRWPGWHCWGPTLRLACTGSDMLAGLCFVPASDLRPVTTTILQMRRPRHRKVKCISGGAAGPGRQLQPHCCSPQPRGLWRRSSWPPVACFPQLTTALCRCLGQCRLCNKNTRDWWGA